MSKTLNIMMKYKALVLAFIGLLLILLAFSLNKEMNFQELLITSIANVGALLLIVGVLQWLFDHSMREEMIREISRAVLGNTHLYEKGIIDCSDNSIEIKREDVEAWTNAEKLMIGTHYTEHFFSHNTNIFEQRCKNGKPTTVLLSEPNGPGIEYLKKIDQEVRDNVDVDGRVKNITRLLTQTACQNQTMMEIRLHSAVLRYLFIATEQAMMTLITFAQVVTRYLNSQFWASDYGIALLEKLPFLQPIANFHMVWALEVTQYLFAWLVQGKRIKT